MAGARRDQRRPGLGESADLIKSAVALRFDYGGRIAMHIIGSLVRRFGRLESISLAVALAWGTVLVIGAVLVPVYQSASGSSSPTMTNGSASGSSSGTMTNGSATLVGVNGLGALLVAGVPLAAAVVTGWALWRRGGQSGAGVLAWVVTGLLVCFNALAMLSIGVFVIPVSGALIVACITHGGRSRGVLNHSGATG
jgi:hypothetical protein